MNKTASLQFVPAKFAKGSCDTKAQFKIYTVDSVVNTLQTGSNTNNNKNSQFIFVESWALYTKARKKKGT